MQQEKDLKEMTVEVLEHWWTWIWEKAKKMGHVSNIETIKHELIGCDKVEHVALFKKSKRNIIDYICHNGENKAVLMTMPTIMRPSPIPQIKDPVLFS